MIVLHTGAMKTGKSEALLKEIHDTKKTDLKDNEIGCYKSSFDIRDYGKIASRNTSLEPVNSKVVNGFDEILKDIIENDLKIIFIDELQFINNNENDLVDLLLYAKQNNVFIVASGLNFTSEIKPFGNTLTYMTLANHIIIHGGKCEICGNDKGEFTDCTISKSDDFLIGNDTVYKLVCANCHKSLK